MYTKNGSVSSLCTLQPFAQTFVQLISGVISSGSAHDHAAENMPTETCVRQDCCPALFSLKTGCMLDVIPTLYAVEKLA